MNKIIFFFFVSMFFIGKTYGQTSYVWSGTTSTAWNTATNWIPNGIPSTLYNVTIVTGLNNCVLPTNKTITNLTITSGFLNLGGFTLTTTGIVACNSGTCSNGAFNSTANSLTFAGTLFNANINATVADIYFNGSVFNSSVTVVKTGASNNSSNGNNTFNGYTSFTNAGTGYFLLTNGSVGRLDNFNGNTIINTTNSGAFYLGYSRDANINGNVQVNNTAGSATIYFGVNNSNINLNTGATITCGTFAGANLRFYKLLQTGVTPQTLSIGTSGSIDMYGSVLNGSFTINAGLISVQTSTFANAVTYNISGTTSNQWSSGGNLYNGILTVNHSSSGYIGFANGTADIYNANVYANNSSTTGGRIIFGNNCTSLFNGNIYVSQSGTTNASGIAIGWNGTFPLVNLASGKNIFINGAFDSGYLQLSKIQTTAATTISLTTTGTSNVQIQQSTFNGNVNITSPDIYAQGGTYNAPTSFVKTGGVGGNHNNGNTNIFNSTLNIENQSTGYFMLSYQSPDQFNDNVTVTSSNSGGIFFGWYGDNGTPTLASGKSISIGTGGFSAGALHFGSFTQIGVSTPLTLTLTGTAMFEVYKNTISSTFNSSVSITAPNIELRGGTFNKAAEFTKTAGTSNHNNGLQNIFNSSCTINQQSTTGYFMLGYNSNDLFNGDIIVTNTGTQEIYFGWGSGTGTPTQAAGFSITVGSAGFNGGALVFNTFTQLGNSPLNLNFTGSTAYLRFARNSIFNGNVTTNTPRIFFDGCTFNGIVNSTKTGSTNDASNGGNTFNAQSTFINNSGAYLLFGNGFPDTWNNDVTFTNSGTDYIYPCWNSIGNIFNGNIFFNSSSTAAGIQFCNNGVSTASMTPGHYLSTGVYDGGYLILQRFTQLGTTASSLTLNATANYLKFGPSSYIGGNIFSLTPNLYIDGCTFNGTSDLTKNGSGGNYGQGGNIFNGLSKITNTGSNYLLLGNSNPDIWNSDVIFTNTGSERLLPAWATVGNIFNGNIYVNTGGSAQGITFCGGNSTATATLAATKSVFTGTLGLNAGYLQLRQFTQLGSAPINLTMSSTATYIQYGPMSILGGNVTSVSPGLYFNGCTFNGTVDCTKNGPTNNDSNGSNIFNNTTNITSTGTGYLMFGNVNGDQFNSTTTFNNFGSNNMYIAYNSPNNVFGGIVNFNNSPITNNLIYVSPYSTGTVFNDNIKVSSTSGQGVQFCTGNTTASATLVATKTISVGVAGFSSGTLLLRQFTQVGPTNQNFTLTGSGNLTFGPSSYFGGNVISSSPTLFYNGVNFNSQLTSIKTGTTNDGSNGGNIFNGITSITNNGAGYLLLGNSINDQFNSATTFNNNGDYRFYFAHNHLGQTTTFASDLTINSNKSVSDGWSFFACEGTNTSMSVGGNLVINCLGSAQSNHRFLQGTGSTAIYNGNVTLNLNNSHTSTQLQMGTLGTSNYNGNIIVANTLGGTSSGILFNTNATASSTLANNKTISLGTGGFVNGDLSIIRFTQLSATSQTMVQTTGLARIILGPTSRFDGNVNFNFPQVYLNGTTYNSIATIEKNGATDNAGTGGNIFNGTTIITNSGSGYLLTGNTTSDLFNALTTFNNTGSYRLYFAHNHTGQTTIFNQPVIINSNKNGGADQWSYLISEGTNSNVQFNSDLTLNNLGAIRSDFRILNGTGTTGLFGGNFTVNCTNTNSSTQLILGQNGISQYNGNIILSNTGGINGMYFNQNGTATSTMAATKSLSAVVGNFSSGILSLPRFTQLGSASNSLPLTGTSNLQFGPTSLFGGDVISTSGSLFFNTTTFNGIVNSIKNGSTNDASFGGNVFNGTTSLTVNGTGYLLMANNSADAYNNNVVFSQNGTGLFYPNHNTNCTYAGNITTNSTNSSTITFGQSGGGIATITGVTAQTINKTGTAGNPVFTRLVVNKSANDVTLNTRINVSSYLTLTQGIINTSSVNILNLNNASTTNIGNSLSYVNGPMNYDMALNGNRILNFPIGKIGPVLSGTANITTSDWRPAILNLTHNSGTSYTYNSELFINSAEALLWSKPSTVSNVSKIHWWDITRTNTSTGINTPTLNLNGNQAITLYYDINDGVTDPTNVTIVKNTYTASTAWKDIGGTGATITAGNITSTSAPTAFNSFSRFTLGNKIGGINPLPIELVTFTATPNSEEKIDIKWITVTETNNSHFEIERSLNALDFEFVTKVNAYGTGNSTLKQSYQTFDEKPYKGISYYRLKQVDFNGEYKYSNNVMVDLVNESTVNLYPNPAKDHITLKASIKSNSKITITNAIGAIVKTIELKNNDVNTIDIADLANGIYYLQVESTTKIETIKFSVVK